MSPPPPSSFIYLFIYFIIESYRKYAHTQKEEREKREKKKQKKNKPLTIKHHTLGLVSAQKTINVIYSITEITR